MSVVKNSLTQAICLGLMTFPSALYAQNASSTQDDKNAVDLDTIIVTGSLVSRVDAETASPVVVMDREQIEQSGKLTLGDLVQSLPGIAGDATNPAVNNGGGDGASTISLRGLGSERTLILIDGHRVVNNDINAIPSNMVERVEVLKVGASALYGSDAIGGVVNFILRKNFEGGQLVGNYGITSAGDGARRGGAFTFGKTWDRGRLVAGVDYNKQNEVSSADREYSKYALYLSSGSVYKGGSSRTPNGYYTVPSSVSSTYGCSGALTSNGSGGYRCYTSSDAYNYQATNLLMTPQERVNTFALGSYDITDNLQAYVNAYHNHTMSNAAIAALPFDANSDGISISADNAYNPFGVDFGEGSTDCNGGPCNYRTRFTTLGQRKYFYDTTTDQDVLGLKGNFGDSSWSWDANFNFGRYVQKSWSYGYVDYDALQEAIDNNEINIFDINDSTTVSWLKDNQSIPRYQTSYFSRQWQASATGSLWDLPAGTVQMASGLLYRKEAMSYNVSANAQMDEDGNCAVSSEACSSSMEGSFNVKEAYAQLFIPLLDHSRIGSLNASISDRYSDYSSVSSSNNSASLQLEWRPVDSLLLRGTWAQVFRAPTISDLYAGPSASSPTFSDPCDNYSGSGHENACAGVPAGGTGENVSQVDTIVSGSKYAGIDLKPEQGTSWDYGIVFSPEWLPGFSVNADWWRVKLKDLITTISAQTVANTCYANDASSYCSFIHRYSNGSIDYIETPTVNIGNLDTQGIDFGFSYAFPEKSWGKLNLAVDTTYIERYDIDTGDSVIHMAGKYDSSYGNFARWRGRGTLGWKLGDWDAQWTMRWIGKVQVGTSDESQGMSADGYYSGVVLNYGDYIYNNVSVGYSMTPAHLRFDLGVDNIANKQPPIMYQNNVLNANTDVSTYDTIGRYYWMRVTYTF